MQFCATKNSDKLSVNIDHGDKFFTFQFIFNYEMDWHTNYFCNFEHMVNVNIEHQIKQFV